MIEKQEITEQDVIDFLNKQRRGQPVRIAVSINRKDSVCWVLNYSDIEHGAIEFDGATLSDVSPFWGQYDEARARRVENIKGQIEMLQNELGKLQQGA